MGRGSKDLMRSLPTKTVREAAGTGSSCPIDQSDVARNLQEGARRSIIPEAAAENDDACLSTDVIEADVGRIES